MPPSKAKSGSDIFRYYCPIRSFSGGANYLLQNKHGIELGPQALWAVGVRAFRKITEIHGVSVSIYELENDYIELTEILSDILNTPIDPKARQWDLVNLTFYFWKNKRKYLKQTQNGRAILTHASSLCILSLVDYAVFQLTSDVEISDLNISEYTEVFEMAVRLETMMNMNDDLNEQASIKAANAAHARHRETRDMMRHAIKYYMANSHKFKSRAAAARAIAHKEVNATERTVDGWLKQHLKQQSAK